MARLDPSTLGKSGYERVENDHYVTPIRTIKSLISVIEDDLPAYPIWEPFCGTGAFTKLLEPTAQNIVSTDIQEYPGFTPDAIVDFFSIQPTAHRQEAFARWESSKLDADAEIVNNIKTLNDVAMIKNFMPDVIISNPPFDEAERCVRHALALMEEVKGDVFFILRNEFDSAKCRADLFRHQTFSRKIVLLHRPRWIEGSTGAPRHNYAYYHWSWSKPAAARPEIYYAD